MLYNGLFALPKHGCIVILKLNVLFHVSIFDPFWLAILGALRGSDSSHPHPTSQPHFQCTISCLFISFPSRDTFFFPPFLTFALGDIVPLSIMIPHDVINYAAEMFQDSLPFEDQMYFASPSIADIRSAIEYSGPQPRDGEAELGFESFLRDIERYCEIAKELFDGTTQLSYLWVR